MKHSTTVPGPAPRENGPAAPDAAVTAAPVAPSFPVWLNRFGVVLLAGFALATSRWGSYLLPGPPYIIDLAIGALLFNRLLLHAAGRNEAVRGRRDALVTIIGGALLAWTALRLIAGEITPDALRDVAPYLYAVVIFLAVPLSGREDATAGRILTWMLLFHLGWVTVTVVFGQLPFMPGIPWAPVPVALDQQSLFVFGLRGDFDTLGLGLLAAISLHRSLAGRRPLLNLGITAWSLAVLFVGFDTKAGLLAIGTQLLLVPVLGQTRKRQAAVLEAGPGKPARTRLQARMAVLAVLLAIVPLGFYLVADSPMVNNLQSVTGLSPKDSFKTSRSVGTTEARRKAWSRVVSWINADSGRAALGVGFGPNYLVDIGANRLLTGPEDQAVRSPHNFWISTWARTGFVGLAITLLLFLTGLRLTFLVIRSGRANDVDVIAILLVIPLTVSATVGVVFESPFGAVPYYWALGRLAVRAYQLGEVQPFAVGTAAPAQEPRDPVPRDAAES